MLLRAHKSHEKRLQRPLESFDNRLSVVGNITAILPSLAESATRRHSEDAEAMEGGKS
jgi:hypothetical protein